MNTPVCDFVKQFAREDPVRLHMPGHKGLGPLGVEALDITEVDGADSLYEASGIIAESEANASLLFGCPTFYSTEGSSLAIRAMLYLAVVGRSRKILAGRNAHKTFLSAAALLDLDVRWLYPRPEDSYYACTVTAGQVEEAIREESPGAVYLTSPDYLGHMGEIRKVAEVCRRSGVLLLVDNAHGAYLRFLEPSLHPIDLGADLCCDSAHKTLPVLTGGAYLHVKDPALAERARQALSLFGSTSPSYLIMQSLDAANPYLKEYPDRLASYLPQVEDLRRILSGHGYVLVGDEPLKITIRTKPFGYTGDELAKILLDRGAVSEFHDPDFLVFMIAPENGDLSRVADILCSIPRKETLQEERFPVFRPHRVLSIREAVMQPFVTLPVERCVGRILAQPSVGCPPAVPILMCGERIDDEAIERFAYYGIRTCDVTDR